MSRGWSYRILTCVVKIRCRFEPVPIKGSTQCSPEAFAIICCCFPPLLCEPPHWSWPGPYSSQWCSGKAKELQYKNICVLPFCFFQFMGSSGSQYTCAHTIDVAKSQMFQWENLACIYISSTKPVGCRSALLWLHM